MTREAGHVIALAHAARGRRVFPFRLAPKPDGRFDKKPHVPWQDEATTDEATIISWWKRWPNALAGWTLPVGTVLADIDDRDAFAATGHELPNAPGQTTIRGGEHRLYRGLGADQTAKVIPGLDTRVGGKGWAALYSSDAFAGDPPRAPAWLIHPDNGRTNGHAPEGPSLTITAPSPAREAIATGQLAIRAGERDDRLASIAGTLIHAGGNAESTALALGLINAAGAIEQPAGDELGETDFRRIAYSIAKTAGAPSPTATAELRTLSWAALMAEPPEPPPVIRPGIPKVGVTVQAGVPKVGKTLRASQIGLESGLPTLLVIEEGSLAGISYRLRTQAVALGIEDPPIVVLHRQRIRLDERRSMARLHTLLTAQRFDLIIFDPLNRLHGADENRPSEMTPVMDALAEIAYGFECAVLAVHHLNKPSAERRGDPWDRFRGASSIRSGTDANLLLDGTGERLHVMGEFRDAEPLSEWLELDRESLIFRPSDEPLIPAKVDPIELRTFVEERRQVGTRQVVERFGVSKTTAIAALRGLGCDEYPGVRGALVFSLGTVQ